MRSIMISTHDECHAAVFHFVELANAAQKELAFGRRLLTDEQRLRFSGKRLYGAEALQRGLELKQEFKLGRDDLLLLVVDANVYDDEDDEYFYKGRSEVAIISLFFLNSQSTFMKEAGAWWTSLVKARQLRKKSDCVLLLILGVVVQEVTDLSCHTETRGCIMDYCQNPTEIIKAATGKFQFCAQECLGNLTRHRAGQALLAVAKSLSDVPLATHILEPEPAATVSPADSMLSEDDAGKLEAPLQSHLASKHRSDQSTPDPDHRFAVAFSFPGEARSRVEAIALQLARDLGRARLLYDHFHEAEFARPNLDIYLQALYHDNSELNVVFLCKDYESKEWCGLEWRTIRDLIKRRRQEIMLLRLDDAPVSGVFSIDGYIDINNRGNDQVASLILQRWNQYHSTSNTRAEAANVQASIDDDRPRQLLKEAGKLPSNRTIKYELHLEKGAGFDVALEAAHVLDLAICTQASYKRWLLTTKLTNCLHHARGTSSTAITLIAKNSGPHYVLLINNTRGRKPIPYTLQISDH